MGWGGGCEARGAKTLERRPEKNYMRTQLLSVFTPNLSLRIHPPRFRDCWLFCRMHLDLPSRGYMRIKEHYPEASRYIRSTPRDGCTNTLMIPAAVRKDDVLARALSRALSRACQFPAKRCPAPAARESILRAFFRLNATAARGKNNKQPPLKRPCQQRSFSTSATPFALQTRDKSPFKAITKKPFPFILRDETRGGKKYLWFGRLPQRFPDNAGRTTQQLPNRGG